MMTWQDSLTTADGPGSEVRFRKVPILIDCPPVPQHQTGTGRDAAAQRISVSNRLRKELRVLQRRPWAVVRLFQLLP